MKKNLFIFLLLTLHIGLEAITLSDKVYINQPCTYMDHSVFSIVSDKDDVGLVLLHMRGSLWKGRIPQYELYTPDEGRVAFGKVENIAQNDRVIFNIEDKNGLLLGHIEENWKDRWYYPVLEIYSANNELIAKGDFDDLGHNLTFYDPLDNTRELVTFSSGFRWTWDINVKDAESLKLWDDRLFLLSATIPLNSLNHSRSMPKTKDSL